MPRDPEKLKRLLFRAGLAYLTGFAAACGWQLFASAAQPEFTAAECIILSLLAGVVTGGWYIGGWWVRRQAAEGIIAPTIENAMNTLLFAGLLVIGPLLFLPAMLAGLMRLRRLTQN